MRQLRQPSRCSRNACSLAGRRPRTSCLQPAAKGAQISQSTTARHYLGEPLTALVSRWRPVTARPYSQSVPAVRQSGRAEHFSYWMTSMLHPRRRRSVRSAASALSRSASSSCPTSRAAASPSLASGGGGGTTSACQRCQPPRPHRTSIPRGSTRLCYQLAPRTWLALEQVSRSEPPFACSQLPPQVRSTDSGPKRPRPVPGPDIAG